LLSDRTHDFQQNLVIYIEGIRLHRVPQARCGLRHPKVMPVILTTDEELDVWIEAKVATAPSNSNDARGADHGCRGTIKVKRH
jgi:hypothetical protein